MVTDNPDLVDLIVTITSANHLRARNLKTISAHSSMIPINQDV